MQIGEVAARTELSLRTIRHYEETGLVVPSARSRGGFRLYTETDVARLMVIRRMKPLGFTLDQMRDLLDATDRLDADTPSVPTSAKPSWNASAPTSRKPPSRSRSSASSCPAPRTSKAPCAPAWNGTLTPTEPDDGSRRSRWGRAARTAALPGRPIDRGSTRHVMDPTARRTERTR